MPALFVAVLVALLAAPAAQTPTPRVGRLEVEGAGAAQILVLRAPLPGTEPFVGLAFMYAGGSPVLQVQFGFFPPRPMRLQLAVRAADGAVERFGEVFTADASSGIHAPHLVDRAEVRRFVEAAFTPGALISNGYVSFFNDAGPPAGAEIGRRIADCGSRGRRRGGPTPCRPHDPQTRRPTTRSAAASRAVVLGNVVAAGRPFVARMIHNATADDEIGRRIAGCGSRGRRRGGPTLCHPHDPQTRRPTTRSAAASRAVVLGNVVTAGRPFVARMIHNAPADDEIGRRIAGCGSR